MANLDLSSVEVAIYTMKKGFEANLSDYTLLHTCAPGGSAEYNRYIMFTHKVRKDSTNEIVCYISYRSKRPVKDEAPAFSSYEIFDGNYNSLKKIHLSDFAGNPDPAEDAFKAAYKYIVSLL